jgi:hypothetical protein
MYNWPFTCSIGPDALTGFYATSSLTTAGPLPSTDAPAGLLHAHLDPRDGICRVTIDRCGSWIAITITSQHVVLLALQRHSRFVRGHVDIQDCCMRVMIQMEMTLTMSAIIFD